MRTDRAWFKRDSRVSIDQMAKIGSDHIRLSVTAAEAERRG